MALAASDTGHDSLVHLSAKSEILTQFLEEQVKLVDKNPPCGNIFSDFDDVNFDVKREKDSPIIQIEFQAMALPAVRSTPGWPLVEEKLAPWMAGSDREDRFTLRLDVGTLADDAARAHAVFTLANLRSIVIGAPLRAALQTLAASGSVDSLSPVAIPMRAGEHIYLVPKADRMNVGFSVALADETDRVIGRLVGGEITEMARKIRNAPGAIFTDSTTGADPPRALQESGLSLSSTPDLLGYFVFSVGTSHCDTQPKLELTVDQIMGFRTYLSYHSKAAKAAMQTRMRQRVASLLTVLARAKRQDPNVAKEKKLMSGRTFVRKV